MKGEDTDAHREALTSRKGKTDYRAKNKQNIQPGHGKPKGKPDNTCKQGEPHEPQMTGCKMSMTDNEMGQGNFQAVTLLGTRRPWIKVRFQLSQLQQTGLNGTARSHR